MSGARGPQPKIATAARGSVRRERHRVKRIPTLTDERYLRQVSCTVGYDGAGEALLVLAVHHDILSRCRDH